MQYFVRRRLVGLGAAVVAVALTAACGSSSSGSTDASGSPSASESKSIGASMINLRDPDLVIMSDAMQAEADASGTKLELLDTKGDVPTELQLIEDLITRKPNAIIMQALDGEASQQAAKQVNAAGIPLFTLSTDFAEGNTLKIESYIGVDDTEAGKIQGTYVNDQLPNGGKILYIVGTYGASWTDRRKAGFEEVVNSNIEVAQEIQANGSRDEGKKVMEDMLTRFGPDSGISGVVCHNDEMCIGAASAIAEAKRQAEFKFVIGVDGTSAGYTAIKEGGMTATVRQDSAGQGTKAIEVINEFLAGKTVDKRYFLPWTLVDKANVGEFAS
jgi:ABC-type sugar transport system substrate-binding protein